MPERNLERKKGLRPRASAGPRASARDYSETASEISEEFAGASEIREKSGRNLGSNSRGIREEFGGIREEFRRESQRDFGGLRG